MKTDKQYIAPKGTLWVCAACGRHGTDRTTIGDESCFLNAVLCVAQDDGKYRAIDGVSRWPTEEELLNVKQP